MPRDSRVNVPLTDPVDIADHRRRHRPAGRYDSHEWLGYDDGGLAEVPFGELVERIADLMADERPDVVGTFGPQPGPFPDRTSEAAHLADVPQRGRAHLLVRHCLGVRRSQRLDAPAKCSGA
jgi:LmbE family N-acetylglucosaminyl deacetylase